MCAKRRPVMAFIPVRLIALSFLAMILLGACLLTLPIAAKSGRVSFFDALFTATSAVCVTGLTVVETGLRFSLFGQVVLLLLIQMGGLGFVTFLTLGFIALGRRITIRDRLLIQEAMNESNIGGMVRLILWVTRMTFCCEGLGAALLCIRFVPEFGLGKGLWYGVFHAVSAFCNAGFDVLGEGVSIARYGKDPLVLLTLSFLIIAGGLGFGAVYDLIRARGLKRARLHTRVVFVATGALLLFGTVSVLLGEWNNAGTLGKLSWGEKLLAAFFQSVTFRTAGFAALNQRLLRPATKFLGTVLMLIGAAPASTGGGLKVTTVGLLLAAAVSIARGRDQTRISGRSVPMETLRRALSIVVIGLGVFVLDVAVIALIHPDAPLSDILYECASAVGTVGLSSWGTVRFHPAARMMLILSMYMGRIGPLSLTLAIAHRQQNEDRILLPEEKIAVG